MCKSCRTGWIIDEQHRDRDALQQGHINEVRTQDQILTSMCAHEKAKGQLENCPWIQGRPETMCTHLKNCQRQPEYVREQAYALCVSRSRTKGPPGARSISLNSSLQQAVDLPRRRPLTLLPDFGARQWCCLCSGKYGKP
ncbi:hypothetical protein K503DRAFT_526769 [Rhizopogon vinicolor AM-OR11-026]|uniref:Uncharacterized protein n=1 Tax=Rhizopogon vinicolor AM-OR11-026 TaxID=1314800 RepID=A0A1B7ML94_9AGAM|nr:hypothetical protein K503DRAFT_526769 [Rhizopogon vinicolor AM-OR11-026]